MFVLKILFKIKKKQKTFFNISIFCHYFLIRDIFLILIINFIDFG